VSNKIVFLHDNNPLNHPETLYSNRGILSFEMHLHLPNNIYPFSNKPFLTIGIVIVLALVYEIFG
jgi:hypothetical protein